MNSGRWSYNDQNLLLFAGGTTLEVDTHLLPVKRAIWQARSDWREIGRGLGVAKGDIRSIHFHDDGECLNRVLCMWMETGSATIHHLLNALEDVTVGRSDIANTILARRGKDRTDVGL